MEALQLWLNAHWFDLVQSLGIVGSILLTTAALRSQARGQRLGHYLTLVADHRELWTEAHRRPDLSRIFRDDVNLSVAPMTTAEEEFLNLAIEHFATGWLMAKGTRLLSLNGLAADAATFFSRPLPRNAWERTRHARDPQFVKFIDRALKHGPPAQRRST